VPGPPQRSELASVSTKARNLCVLNARLDASEMLASSAQMVRSKRALNQAERDFTPWRTICRIANQGNHIIVMVDGTYDVERWEELGILLRRLRAGPSHVGVFRSTSAPPREGMLQVGSGTKRLE